MRTKQGRLPEVRYSYWVLSQTEMWESLVLVRANMLAEPSSYVAASGSSKQFLRTPRPCHGARRRYNGICSIEHGAQSAVDRLHV